MGHVLYGEPAWPVIHRYLEMLVSKVPLFSITYFLARLSKGMGHVLYGEPAWPNDILYIFPGAIIGNLSSILGLSLLDPIGLGEPSDPFATPTHLLPEWYFYAVFNLLRLVENKLAGLICMASVPVLLISLPVVENLSIFQNPMRRPHASCVFISSVAIVINVSITASLDIRECWFI